MSSGAAGLMKAVRWATFFAIPSGGAPFERASVKISVWCMDCSSLKYVLLSLKLRSVNVFVPVGVAFGGGGLCGPEMWFPNKLNLLLYELAI